jgi:hypothetical protein
MTKFSEISAAAASLKTATPFRGRILGYVSRAKEAAHYGILTQGDDPDEYSRYAWENLNNELSDHAVEGNVPAEVLAFFAAYGVTA